MSFARFALKKECVLHFDNLGRYEMLPKAETDRIDEQVLNHRDRRMTQMVCLLTDTESTISTTNVCRCLLLLPDLL